MLLLIVEDDQTVQGNSSGIVCRELGTPVKAKLGARLHGDVGRLQVVTVVGRKNGQRTLDIGTVVLLKQLRAERQPGTSERDMTRRGETLEKLRRHGGGMAK
ncbi:hypothetical protein NL676_006998 [Syzygium grande]|nr:hypothetical protein NL676_006998 [Syzygium grande]